MQPWEQRQLEIVNSFNQLPTSQRVKVLFILAKRYGLFVSSDDLQSAIYGRTGKRAHGAIVEIIKGLRLAAERENLPYDITRENVYGKTFWCLDDRCTTGGIHVERGSDFQPAEKSERNNSGTCLGCMVAAADQSKSGMGNAVNGTFTGECYEYGMQSGEKVGDQGEEKLRALDHSQRRRSRALWRDLGIKTGL